MKRSQGDCEVYVAGIGASAGGLEALEALFRRMPHDTGLAFVVIQHLSPDFESHMAELLGRQTDIPIHTAEDGMLVERDVIYLLPPRKEMIIADGRLRLIDKDSRHAFTLPIDRFFRSLAQDRGSCAIGVVLSGTGSDGTRGVRDIHSAGGLVIVQSTESAKFDGMPLNAIGTGVPDLVLPPEAIPDALTRYVQESLSREQLAEQQQIATADGVDGIVQLLRGAYDIDFACYKPHTVLRRISRRQSLQQDSSLEAYVERLKSDPLELNELYRDLLIGVTRFFRDREAFDILEHRVFPELLERVPRDDEIRVWVAGCATGEEPYSLAILLHEMLQKAGRPVNVKVFATDVHRTSLELASTGVYSEESLEEMTRERRERYFLKKADGYHVLPEIRQLVVFAAHNVLSDAPFTRMDLVSCRNMLIYLQGAGQRTAISLFHFALKVRGVLFLGASETPGELADEFEPIDKRWKLYTKRRDVHLPTVQLHPPPMGTSLSSVRPIVGLPVPARRTTENRLLSVYDRLLSKYMPAGFLIDEQFQLIHTFADAGRYLVIRPGRHSTNLLDLIHSDIRTSVSGAVHHALKGKKTVRFSGIHVSTGTGDELVDLTVEPFFDERARSPQLLVTLTTREVPEDRVPPEIDLDAAQVARDHVQALENDLRFTRENLQATIEELETANEELQATNEELVASNEELQSTNEELHSVNEELYTVNAEYQRKITELQQMTDDLDNLLVSSDVGVIFLDRDLAIRRYTPRMVDSFHLMPQDVGRPIANFANTLDDAELMEDLQRSLRGERTVEREVQDREGNPYFLRILPYRTGGRIAGVVMTLIDITPLKRQEILARQLSTIVETSGDPILMLDLEGRVQTWNRAATLLYGYSEAEAIGQSIYDLIVPEERRAELERWLQRVRSGERIEPVESVRRCKDGRLVEVSFRLSAIRDAQNRIVGVSRIDRDITERKQAERRLAAEHATTHALAESTTLEQAVPRLVDALSRTLGLDVVEYWTLSETTHRLTCSWIHVAQGLGIGRLWRDAAQETSYGSGEGLPGRAWEEKQPCWRETTAEEAAPSAGDGTVSLRSAFAFPILAGENCLAVICCYQRTSMPRSDSLEQTLAAIGREVGQFALWSQSEQRLRQLAEVVEQMHELVGTMDLDRRLLTLNSAGRRLLGISRTEDVTTIDVASIHPDWAYRRILQEGLPRASELGGWTGETAVVNREGKEIPVSQVILAHHDATGEIRYYSTVARDLSQQKAYERELNAAREAAEAANVAKSTFLAHISHEVRTPMTAIIGLSELLLPGETNAQRAEMLEMVGENGRYLTEILNDILDLSKIEAGRFDVDLTRCSPVPLLANLKSLMDVRARGQGLQLHLEYQTAMPETIQTDPIRLRQILVNLVGNAIKFTDQGSVRIVVELLKEDDPPHLRFTIIDTGCGIPASELQHIFEPFVQGEGRGRWRPGGTGLGLPISRRLAAALGGTVTVRSKVGEGSEFALTVPIGSLEGVDLLEPEEALRRGKLQIREPVADVDLQGIRVLVAEDTRSVQFLVRRMLEAQGAGTTLVGDGRQAVDAVFDGHAGSDGAVSDGNAAHDGQDGQNGRDGKDGRGGKDGRDGHPLPFDLILMDMNMPVMNGFDAIQELQSRGCRIPIVALTAGAMRGDRERCLKAGCVAYITKPIDREELMATLKRVLKR